MVINSWIKGSVVREDSTGRVGMIVGSFRSGHHYDRYRVFEVMTSVGIVHVDDYELTRGTWQLVIDKDKP